MSAATISRYLTRQGLVTPEPGKRPRSSYIRFAAELPNERWQSDFIHHHLTGGTEVEVVSWLDDHSRYTLSVTGHPETTGQVRATAGRIGLAGPDDSSDAGPGAAPAASSGPEAARPTPLATE